MLYMDVMMTFYPPFILNYFLFNMSMTLKIFHIRSQTCNQAELYQDKDHNRFDRPCISFYQ